jgi:acyl-CoA hydrolase
MTRRVSIEQLCGSIVTGERLFLAGSTGEPTAFVRAWLADPERTRAIDVTTSFVPGINPLPIDLFHRDARVSGLFMHPSLIGAKRGAAFRLLPLSYGGFVRHLRTTMRLDTVVVHVSPPDRDGYCSLGPAVEFVPEVLRIANRVLAVVNPNIPHMTGSVSVPLDRIEAWCESDDPLCVHASEAPDALSVRVAEQVAAFVADGATLQIGLGKVPTALLRCLTDRRELRFFSGLVTEDLTSLMSAGALAMERPSTSCALLGSSAFYTWLRDQPEILVRGCEETHDPWRLARIKGFVAVNSALEVDLLGQANLETVGGRGVSGVGGSPDFAHAASLSEGGISVVALPACGRNGHSRIVARMPSGVPVSLPRYSVDVVATEWGAADLRGRSTNERAQAIMNIAAPGFREELSRMWHSESGD